MNNDKGLKPPVARVEPKTLTHHGHTRVDDYYWMRSDKRDDPEVLAHLEAENAYTSAVMKPLEGFQETLFEEIKGRIKKDDASVPYELDGFWFYTRYTSEGEYPLHCRRKGTMEAPEEVMLDVNAEAEGHDYYRVTGLKVSSGQDILAYAEDTVSRRVYTVRFKNLSTGQMLPDKIEGTSGSSAWATDNKTLFYVKREEKTLRAYQVWRHTLGSDPATDEMIFEETDDTFSVRVRRTKSKAWIVIESDSTLVSEARIVPAGKPMEAFRVFLPREAKHEYSVRHADDTFYVRTNWGAKNFRLMATAPDKSQDKGAWREIIPHRETVFFSHFDVFKDHLVVGERREGLQRLRVIPWAAPDKDHELAFDEPAYMAFLSTNPRYDTSTVRFFYSALTTPDSTYDYDMVSREKTLKKQDEVLGGFESADYTSERWSAKARDGVDVPVSIVYRKDLDRSVANPLYLYAYGSYGYSMDPYFSASRLSLLDRGFIFAIAHVRGGQEMGRDWYEAGKLLKKMNTFTDFIDCGQALVDKKYTAPEMLFAAGGSAGGMLMGGVINMRPELFRGVVAKVPFVDVVTTMLDETIPLTTFEYDEWGNPNDKAYYDYMLSYSPYDNVEAKDYPNLLVTTGLHDSQVQYWEPAKWVARLRAMKTDDKLLLFHINMEAGHGGASGRFRRYRELAREYAFILDLVDRAEVP